MTAFEAAFNQAGVWAAKPGLIERARREMVVALHARRKAQVRAAIRAEGHVSAVDLELAVRELSARVSLERGRVSLPGMNGWRLAGKRKAG